MPASQLYDPDRLKYPLLRKGARGEGKWQRLTWDQALDHAAEQMQRIGREYTRCGFLFMAGTDMQSTFVHRFAEVVWLLQCHFPRIQLPVEPQPRISGHFSAWCPFPDVLNCKYIIMPGANRFEALVTPDSIDLMTAMQNGCKLVVLDPRFTKTAALANEWYRHQARHRHGLFSGAGPCPDYQRSFMIKIRGRKDLRLRKVQRACPTLHPGVGREGNRHPGVRTSAGMARELAAACAGGHGLSRAAQLGLQRLHPDPASPLPSSTRLLGNWDREGGLILPKKIKTGSISLRGAVLRRQSGRPGRCRPGADDVRRGRLLQTHPRRGHRGQTLPHQRLVDLQDQPHADRGQPQQNHRDDPCPGLHGHAWTSS